MKHLLSLPLLVMAQFRAKLIDFPFGGDSLEGKTREELG